MQHKRFVRGLGAMLLASLAFPATAQYGSSAIVDPNAALADSLKTLAREPKNLQALIAAGRASLELGDMQSAAGFFGRADEAYPSSPYPKIGMGAALTMSGDARGALAQFQRAAALGAPASSFAIDRGLAYDLLGQQAQAQADYRTAMIGAQADEARRRLALSLAISRDFNGASAALAPLLARRDQASIRTNAFVQALAGDRVGAQRTIDQAMPGQGARFAPYFQMLPVLRNEEKAAAVHLGEFPQDAAQRYAQAEPVPPSPVTTVSNRSTVVGQSDTRPSFRDAKPVKVKTAKVDKPKVERHKPVRVADNRTREVRERQTPNVWTAEAKESVDPMRYVSRPRENNSKKPPVRQEVQAVDPEPRPVADSLSPLPSEREPLVPVTEAPPLNAGGEPLLEPVASVETIDLPPPPTTPKLEIETPPRSRPKVELAARETRTKAAPKPAEPATGAKGTHWVQLAGSGSKAMMASEFKKIRGKKPDLFKGQAGHVTIGKDYFRLLVGPFDSADEAQSFVTKLDKAGIDGFRWTRTPAQIKIEKLPG